MKLTPRQVQAFIARPDPKVSGLLLYGANAMRVACRRQEVLDTLLGPGAGDELRLTRLSAGAVRGDAAALADAVRARGFFAGPRAVVVEEAGDALAPVIRAGLGAWQPGDARIIVTAGRLGPSSALRKLFEGHKTACAAAIYDDPPAHREVEAHLQKAGVGRIDPAALADVMALAQSLAPGEMRQMARKLALYKHGDDSPLTPADVAACAPATVEAALDDILHVVAEARTGKIGPLITRLGGQGVQPVGLCIAALRHFRTLHMAAGHPKGPLAGLAAARPPIFGPRRDRMTRQAQNWGVTRLEGAIRLLVDTDLTLRSTQKAPQMALMERALIRLAMMMRRTGRGRV
ncbi:MAG: DNA polymerase III subunit delta [Rhodobacteraceae bacterium]|nr:DNA polymerase III subunit delta [Paracoccaceae bacterium]